VKKLIALAIALAALGDLVIEAYTLYSVNELQARMALFDEKYTGTKAAAAIQADFESYRQSMYLCDQICSGQLETFLRNDERTECTCRSQQ
jgi:uncharacterized small protein (DUF1192 family)